MADFQITLTPMPPNKQRPPKKPAAPVDDWRHAIAQAKRREAEAPLVALVATVPEGLDPNGWRAAVLAAYEDVSGQFSGPLDSQEFGAHCEAAIRGGGLDAFADARHAYRRAIAPHKAPPPVRKTRGVSLPCDAYDD